MRTDGGSRGPVAGSRWRIGRLLGRRPASARGYEVALYGLMTPYLVATVVLVGVPAVLSFVLAFTQYDALSPPVWDGLGRFQAVLEDPLFYTALLNSLYFVALAVPLRVLGALGLALLLNRRARGVGGYRAAVYLPTVIPDVAYALIWLWIFNPVYGPLNLVLRSVGLPGPAWLADGDTARLAIVVMSAFQIGEGFIVLLAGLQNIPRDYYDAAAVFGAGRWQMFRMITLPLMAPWLLLLTLRDIILSAQSTFTPALFMTGGGPYYATTFMPVLIYREAFDDFRFGEATAMMVLMFLGIGILLYLVYRLVGGWGYSGEH